MANLLNPVNIMQRWSGASANVVSAIKSASEKTGISFDYLMNKAKQESSFNPGAKAGTSSATGLFQFIDSTWLGAVKEYGDKFGLNDLADKISTDGKGRPQVTDETAKQQILKLRENPEIAADITGAMTKDNKEYLENALGDKVGTSDLYLAHFLGLGGAEKFLKGRQDNPDQAAADLFPGAAAANKNVFFDASGRKKSVDEVYAFFAKKMDSTGSDPVMTELAAKVGQPAASPVIAKNAAGNDIIFPNAISATDDITAINWGQRQMLKALLTGVSAIGDDTQNATSRHETGLLSPYTSYVLAQMKAPGDKAQDKKS